MADRGDGAAPRGPGGPRGLLILVLAAVVIAVDQVTKSLAVHHLSRTVDGAIVGDYRHVFASLYFWLTFNPGIAFGLGRGATPIIETVVVLLVVVLLVFGRRAARHSSIAEAVGVGLLIGGALGNLSDRLFRDYHGAVVDFIDIAQISGHQYWPVFNVADMCVVVGAVVLAWHYAFGGGRRPPVAPDEPPDGAARSAGSPDGDGRARSHWER